METAPKVSLMTSKHLQRGRERREREKKDEKEKEGDKEIER